MSPKTKAILKTAGAVLTGAVVFAYLPLVSFAVAPQAIGWLHFGLATIHPLLGEVLLGASVLSGVGLAIKKIWGRYFEDKRIEKKIEKILKQKALERKKSIRDKQKTPQYDYVDEEEMPCEEPQKTATKAPKKLTHPVMKELRNRRQRDAA